MGIKATANRRLISARERRGWTQAEVAAALGVSELTVGRWERGETFPHPYHRKKLCELFGKSEQELGVSRLQRRFSALFSRSSQHRYE